MNLQLCWQGPQWLQQSATSWPSVGKMQMIEDIPEERRIQSIVAAKRVYPKLSMWRDFNHLLCLSERLHMCSIFVTVPIIPSTGMSEFSLFQLIQMASPILAQDIS